MAHEGLKHVTDQADQHLGGNISVGDPFSYSPRTWQYLMERFAIRSLMDLGSGRGYAAHWFHGKGVAAVSVDGLKQNCDYAVHPTLHVDLTQSGVYCPVDLVLCVEMVEHLEEKYLPNLLDSLCCGQIIVMTNALPGQGGYHHVNEQPTEYWIQKLQERGCSLALDDSKQIRNIAAQEGALHIARTGTVFVNNHRVNQ